MATSNGSHIAAFIKKAERDKAQRDKSTQAKKQFEAGFSTAQSAMRDWTTRHKEAKERAEELRKQKAEPVKNASGKVNRPATAARDARIDAQIDQVLKNADDTSAFDAPPPTPVAPPSQTGWKDAIPAITLDALANLNERLSRRAESAPLPGGIGALVWILVLLLFFIIPVNSQGYTRMQLIWFTLTGRADIDQKVMDQVQSEGTYFERVAEAAGTEIQKEAMSLVNQAGQDIRQAIGSAGNVVGSAVGNAVQNIPGVQGAESFLQGLGTFNADLGEMIRIGMGVGS